MLRNLFKKKPRTLTASFAGKVGEGDLTYQKIFTIEVIMKEILSESVARRVVESILAGNQFKALYDVINDANDGIPDELLPAICGRLSRVVGGEVSKVLSEGFVENVFAPTLTAALTATSMNEIQQHHARILSWNKSNG